MIIDLSLNIDLKIHFIGDDDAIKVRVQESTYQRVSSRIVSSSSRMSFKLLKIPKIFYISLYLNGKLVARSH